jgi:hypothetical protein
MDKLWHTQAAVPTFPVESIHIGLSSFLRKSNILQYRNKFNITDTVLIIDIIKKH